MSDDRLPHAVLSERAHHAACRRAGRRSRAAGGAALPHPRVGANRTRVAHRSRRGGDARRRSVRLLREMAAKKVLVEIALTSNDMILGVKGARHPLRTYLQYGVPVALVTDDTACPFEPHAGVLKAVEDQGLDYLTVKRMVRNSIEYSVCRRADQSDARAGPRDRLPPVRARMEPTATPSRRRDRQPLPSRRRSVRRRSRGGRRARAGRPGSSARW